MLGHVGQEPDARLHRGVRYQPQRGLVQVGAIGKSRILPRVNQRVQTRPPLPSGRRLLQFRLRTSYPDCAWFRPKVVCPGGPAGVGWMVGSGVAAGGPGTFASILRAGSRI